MKPEPGRASTLTRLNNSARAAARALTAAVPIAVAASLALTGPPGAAAAPKCGGKRATIVGTPGKDVIRTPRSGRQVIAGRGGDDVIFTRNGKDVVCGGAGNDRIHGGIGPDRLFGGPGDDKVFGGRGADLITGDAGEDVLVGGRGKDRARGGPGSNVIRGGIGPDRISGGGEDDRIYGGSNRDRVHGAGGDDFVDGGPGGDRLWGGPGDDLLRGRDGGDRIYGGTGNDRAHGDLVDDRLRGGPGDDVLVGGHGIDLMNGDSGDDLLRGDTNRNVYDGGPGRDTASFATVTPGVGILSGFGVVVNLRRGRAVADGTSKLRGIEHILGSSFRDELIGVPGASVDGGYGNDQCSGFSLAGNCSGPQLGQRAFVDARDPRDPGLVLIGGDGQDRWSVAGAPGGVRIEAQTPLSFDDEGCDRLDGSTIGCAVVPRFVVAWGSDGGDSIEVDGGLPVGVTVDIDGGFGADRLSGGPGDDVLVDRGGASRVRGRGGSDALISGPGKDILSGGSGNDQMVTTHVCHGHAFNGGKGNLDIAGFARARFAIRAQRGGKVRALKGRKRCRATRIRMSSEVLEGTRFGDVLIGTRRADFLIGGRGRDLLIGRGGRDQLSGGAGRDRCVTGRAAVKRSSCERR